MQRSIPGVVDYLEAHLGRPRGCDELARRAGLSAHHFNRRFRSQVGEPPWAHLRRLRLERGALLLAMTELPVCGVALEVGYQTHEAFTRAFRSRFGTSPLAYRAEHSRTRLAVRGGLAVVERPPRRIAYLRHVGPYDDHPEAFARLRAWAARLGVRRAGPELVVYWDDQRITDPRHTRCDVAWEVGEHVAAEGEVRIGTVSGGRFAVARAPAPYRAEVARALYDETYQKILRSRRWQLAPDPPFECRDAASGSGSWIHVGVRRVGVA